MKLALYGLVAAALLALGNGCANCCGPFGARPGAGCDTTFAEALWSESCDTKCNGSTGPRCTGPECSGPRCGGGCGSPLDILFGGGVCNAGCTTAYADGSSAGGNSFVGGSGSANNVGFGGGNGFVDSGYPNCLGCNNPNCLGGRLGDGSAAGYRAQMIRQTAGHIGQKAAALHCNRPNCCANGWCGQAMGPTQGSVQYPYYTTRGPRDFFLANPPGIGP
jgi:hypothetical protein